MDQAAMLTPGICRFERAASTIPSIRSASAEIEPPGSLALCCLIGYLLALTERNRGQGTEADLRALTAARSLRLINYSRAA
jgi:hypothetical protein